MHGLSFKPNMKQPVSSRHKQAAVAVAANKDRLKGSSRKNLTT